MVIVPVLIKTQKYCSILDLQFEILQGDIHLEDKEKLNVVGVFMNKYPETTGIIEGHSDDIGTAAFNLKLSQQRAESVVAYLRETFHIADNRLQAIGYGKSRPIASNSTRAGQQANRRINAVIACATDIEGLKVAAARVTMAMEIEFDPFKSDISPVYFEELAKVAKFMKANPTVVAKVEGHANRFVGLGKERVRVTPALAIEVSEQRAQNVVNYLVEKHGIDRSRLTTSNLGQTNRVSYGTTLDGQQENRRVNIIFDYGK
jgi:OOP family OmpA-OmpF porin